MPTIQNINRLQDKLATLADKYLSKGTPSVVVGYTANYAVYVHERPARHSPGKQSKFLEQPAREMGGELGQTVGKLLRSGSSLLVALHTAGLSLQRASQLIVPVDTGNLKGGAFTANEDDLQAVLAVKDAQLTKSVGKQKEQWNKKTPKQKANYRKKKQARMKNWKKS